MATKVELNATEITNIINKEIKSLQREKTKGRSPAFNEVLDKDIAKLQNAINTLTEAK